mmetsp:Transcript_128137/g.255868  ORF Transcript_128137/g.255868 Transcript_128137/m.255868 type:complete len:215 (+) Transcript_128137:488-1132(+)
MLRGLCRGCLPKPHLHECNCQLLSMPYDSSHFVMYECLPCCAICINPQSIRQRRYQPGSLLSVPVDDIVLLDVPSTTRSCKSPARSCVFLEYTSCPHPVNKEFCSLFKEPRRSHAVVTAVKHTQGPLSSPGVVQILCVVWQHKGVIRCYSKKGGAHSSRSRLNGHQFQRIESCTRRDLRADHVQGPAQNELRHWILSAVNKLLGYSAQVSEGRI